MATVTVRKLDAEVVDRLKRRARDHNRSLEAELREILTRTVRSQRTTRMSGPELRELAKRIAARTPDVPQTDAAELVRAMRDEATDPDEDDESLVEHPRLIVTEVRAGRQRPLDRETFRAFAERLAAKTPPGPRVDSVELLREDRNR